MGKLRRIGIEKRIIGDKVYTLAWENRTMSQANRLANRLRQTHKYEVKVMKILEENDKDKIKKEKELKESDSGKMPFYKRFLNIITGKYLYKIFIRERKKKGKT